MVYAQKPLQYYATYALFFPYSTPVVYRPGGMDLEWAEKGESVIRQAALLLRVPLLIRVRGDTKCIVPKDDTEKRRFVRIFCPLLNEHRRVTKVSATPPHPDDNLSSGDSCGYRTGVKTHGRTRLGWDRGAKNESDAG